jgi:hypothetical protein
MLKRTIYLRIEMGVGGDGFSDSDDGAVLQKPKSMLQARLFARGCGMVRGVEDLRSLFNKRPQDISKFEEEMKKNCLTSMLELFKNFKEDRILPCLEETLLAIVEDFRRHRKLSNEEEVGIFIHIDEHQMFYNKVKNYFNLNEVAALNHQKNVFYPLIQLKTNVVNFALENKIFIMPFFTGTSHDVLSHLIYETIYRKLHLALNPLSIENAQHFLMKVLKEKSPSFNVHSTWLTRKNKSSNSIVPIDILTGEVLRMPNYVETTLPELILKEEFKKYFEESYDIQHLKNFFASLKDIVDVIHAATLEKGMNKSLMLAIATGVYLQEAQFKKIGGNEISSSSIFSRSTKETTNFRILMMPILVKKAFFFPSSILKIMKFEYLEYKLIGTQSNRFSNLFEEVTADRIGMMFELFKTLNINTFSIETLLGESFVELSSSTVFDDFFYVPKRSIISNEHYKINLSKNIFTEGSNLHYNADTLHAIEAEEDAEVKELFDCGVGFLSLNKKHPVSDVVVFLKAVEDYNLILSISVKGSQLGDDEGSFTMSKSQNFDILLRDVNAIASFKKLDLKKKTKHCLVYVTSRYHSENELVRLKKKIANHTELQAILKATDISVVLVHDMDDYLPLIAHRLRIEVSSDQNTLSP